MSWLAMKASKGIGWFLVHSPPGERKSGIPHSVEIPAPVNGTIAWALFDQVAQAGDRRFKIGGNHCYIVRADLPVSEV